jgi:hypothetical protein
MNEAFARYDGMKQAHEEQVPFEGHNLEEVKIDIVILKNPKHFDVLMEGFISKASTPLFQGSSTSMLLTILLFLNLKIMHLVSNVFMDEIFSLLKTKLLPKENKMLATFYEVFKMIKSLGLSYDSIHACVNGCVFFHNTLRHLQVCPKCGIDRFVDGSKSIP